MAHIGTQNYNRYGDALARKRKRTIAVRIVAIVIIFLVIVLSAGYFIFFTAYFQVADISLSGFKTINDSDIRSIVASTMDGQILGQKKNILFFNSNVARDKILARFPVLKSVEIKKEYFHKVSVNLTERTPIGTWCFAGGCRYFDDEGSVWGDAMKSSGSLILSIEDLRITAEEKIDRKLLDSILKINTGLGGLGIKIRRIEIPTDYSGDIRVYVASPYYLIINTEANIDQSMDTLKIFLDDRGEDFSAEYVDLRIEGRVYYK